MLGVYGIKVCEKITVLFIAMIFGYIAGKSKILDGRSTKALSGLLAYITNPCLIVASLQAAPESSVIVLAGKVFIMSMIIHAAMIFVSRLAFIHVKDAKQRSVYSFALMYMNCGYMGYPIMQAIFPDYGLLYGVVYTIPFNLFTWTHGVALMNTGEKQKTDYKKIFLNPGILSTLLGALLFVSGVRFPIVITEGIDMVGGMTFPLSMIIIGSLMSEIKFTDMFKNVKILLFSFIKLVLVPLAMLGICLLAGSSFDFTLSIVCVTMCASPAAANTAVLAEVYDSDSTLAAKLVGVSTLFCLITMPALLILAENLLK